MPSLLFTQKGIFSFFVSIGTIVLLLFFYFVQNSSLTAKGLSELPKPLKAAKTTDTVPPKTAENKENVKGKIVFLNNYAAAVQESKNQKKPLLTYFFISDKDSAGKDNTEISLPPVFSNAEVKTLSSRFVCAALEVCQNAALCKTLEVNKYPSVLLFDAAGVEVQRLSGKQVEQELAVRMHAVIQASVAKVPSAVR